MSRFQDASFDGTKHVGTPITYNDLNHRVEEYLSNKMNQIAQAKSISNHLSLNLIGVALEKEYGTYEEMLDAINDSICATPDAMYGATFEDMRDGVNHVLDKVFSKNDL